MAQPLKNERGIKSTPSISWIYLNNPKDLTIEISNSASYHNTRDKVEPLLSLTLLRLIYRLNIRINIRIMIQIQCIGYTDSHILFTNLLLHKEVLDKCIYVCLSDIIMQMWIRTGLNGLFNQLQALSKHVSYIRNFQEQ